MGKKLGFSCVCDTELRAQRRTSFSLSRQELHPLRFYCFWNNKVSLESKESPPQFSGKHKDEVTLLFPKLVSKHFLLLTFPGWESRSISHKQNSILERTRKVLCPESIIQICCSSFSQGKTALERAERQNIGFPCAICQSKINSHVPVGICLFLA